MVLEVALSLILLVGAGLLVRSFVTLLNVEPGLNPRGVLTVHLSVPSDKYPAEQVAERLLEPLLERARALPGVQSVGLNTLLPVQQASLNGTYTVEGAPPLEPGSEPVAEYRLASPDFFKSLGIPLLAGRDFTEQDGQGELGIIINQKLARQQFAEQSAVGRRLQLSNEAATIIGVVGDVRQLGLDQQPLPEIPSPTTIRGPDPGSSRRSPWS